MHTNNMSCDITELSKKAAEIILSTPRSTRIRVVSHYDADGITAAAIICIALYNLGYDFHATLMRNPFTKGLERLKREENELIIFSDMGSGQIETIEQLGCKAIIIDHHQYIKPEVEKKQVFQINANLCGIDGNYEASGATLSYAVATALDKKNEELAPLALAGATGDKQYIGGIRGYNKEIMDRALRKGMLRENTGIKLYGDTIFDALYFSVDPYYPGITGNQDEIEKILDKIGIDKNMSIDEIKKEKKVRLQSFLLYHLIKKGCQKNILDTIIRRRYWSDRLGLGCELERFADLLDACGKSDGHRSLGLAVCLGDKESFEEAKKVEKKYRQRILEALLLLERNGANETNSIRYFYSDNSSVGGIVCGIAINYIFDEKKPLFSISRKKNEIHVSCRGNQFLVEKGLDLGYAMKTISSEIGGHGGGHKIAAGATIDIEKEQKFLEKADEIISRQIKK